MRYPGDRHVLPLFGPWRWAPYMRGKFYWKKYQNARSFFLSHTTKLNQQKQWNVVPKSTAKIDPSNKYNIFPSFIIDQSWNTLQLKNIVLSFHPPFQPITALFTFTGLWPTVAVGWHDCSVVCLHSGRRLTGLSGACAVVEGWHVCTFEVVVHVCTEVEWLHWCKLAGLYIGRVLHCLHVCTMAVGVHVCSLVLTVTLKILCWTSTHLFSQSLPFLHLQVCDLQWP